MGWTVERRGMTGVETVLAAVALVAIGTITTGLLGDVGEFSQRGQQSQDNASDRIDDVPEDQLCDCSWIENQCGAGSCAGWEMQQIRDCAGTDCPREGQTRCVTDRSCGEPPATTPGGGDGDDGGNGGACGDQGHECMGEVPCALQGGQTVEATCPTDIEVSAEAGDLVCCDVPGDGDGGDGSDGGDTPSEPCQDLGYTCQGEVTCALQGGQTVEATCPTDTEVPDDAGSVVCCNLRGGDGGDGDDGGDGGGGQDLCDCSWNDLSCGGRTCADGKRLQRKTCGDYTCGEHGNTRCVHDPACTTDGGGDGGDGEDGSDGEDGGDGGTEDICTADSDCGGDQQCLQDIGACVTAVQCEPLRISGHPDQKADILFIAKGYDRQSAFLADIRFGLDHPNHEGEPSGLFNVEPMVGEEDRFNVWYIDAGTSIGDYGENMHSDTMNDWVPRCSFTDYPIVLSKHDFGTSSHAIGRGAVFMNDVSSWRTVAEGPSGLPHEWGHLFGGLKDEYHYEGLIRYDGRSAGTLEEWFVEVGDQVQTGDPIATVSLPSDTLTVVYSGDEDRYVWERHRSVGDELAPGALLATVGGRDATPSASEVDALVAEGQLINCVDTRDQAERVWGHLADRNSDIGFFQGCAYNHLNWRPTEGTIMGGGLEGGNKDSFGPVNTRIIEGVLSQYD